MFVEHLRAQSWLVQAVASPEAAWAAIELNTPDVVVIDAGAGGLRTDEVSRFIVDSRFRLDDATSIIVMGLSDADERQRLRASGADLFLLAPLQPSEIAYEVKRALILRRSGRRLSWNWPASARGEHEAPRRGRAS
jgi:DNA-binding response OmpR family regulator